MYKNIDITPYYIYGEIKSFLSYFFLVLSEKNFEGDYYARVLGIIFIFTYCQPYIIVF